MGGDQGFKLTVAHIGAVDVAGLHLRRVCPSEIAVAAAGKTPSKIFEAHAVLLFKPQRPGARRSGLRLRYFLHKTQTPGRAPLQIYSADGRPCVCCVLVSVTLLNLLPSRTRPALGSPESSRSGPLACQQTVVLQGVAEMNSTGVDLISSTHVEIIVEFSVERRRELTTTSHTDKKARCCGLGDASLSDGTASKSHLRLPQMLACSWRSARLCEWIVPFCGPSSAAAR